MKKLLFIISVFSILLISTATATKSIDKCSKTTVENLTEETKYEQGWKDGHCEGWREIKGQYAYCPYPPYAPYPQYPKSSDSYKDGYNDGFLRGMRDARK